MRHVLRGASTKCFDGTPTPPCAKTWSNLLLTPE